VQEVNVDANELCMAVVERVKATGRPPAEVALELLEESWGRGDG
jgi:hypothetical protein